MNSLKQCKLTISASGDAAYLQIPFDSSVERKVAKNVMLRDLLSGYLGPEIVLDFDNEGRLLGIEILR